MHATVPVIEKKMLDGREQELVRGQRKQARWTVPQPNMPDYEAMYRAFRWPDVEKELFGGPAEKVNMGEQCIDRHARTGLKNKVALWYLDECLNEKKYTFGEMQVETNKFANTLRDCGVKKGDRVAVYLSQRPELYIAMMGIAKVGAVSLPLFEAFMGEAIYDRLHNCGATAIVTSCEAPYFLEKRIPFAKLPALKSTILTGSPDHEPEAHEHLWNQKMAKASKEFDVEWMGLEDRLNIMYTSGSTGAPKGVVHANKAMVGHYATTKYSLDLNERDVYWCTASPGWVTGTNYGIYGPWLLGATTVVLGARMEPSTWYRAIEKAGVTVWYSAPTAFRTLMAKSGDPKEIGETYDLSSLRNIYSVGEPLNPECVRWGLKAFGKPIRENWWMTECGMQLIGNYPAIDLKLGSMGKPFPGTEAAIVDDHGKPLPPYTIGNLAVKAGWPSMMVAIWGNKEKYDSYFKGKNKEWYISGDSAHMDSEGYFFFHGRVDDVIKTSGERVGPAEVEHALLEHPAVAESGVIGKPDPEGIRGDIIKAFVSLRPGFAPSDELKRELMVFVGKTLAAHEKPREIEFVPNERIQKIPKTRSGKIRRRDLRALELGLEIGDTSTLED